MNALSDILSPESFFSLLPNLYQRPAREAAHHSFVCKSIPPIYLCIDFQLCVLRLRQASAPLSHPMTFVVQIQIDFPNVSNKPLQVLLSWLLKVQQPMVSGYITESVQMLMSVETLHGV